MAFDQFSDKNKFAKGLDKEGDFGAMKGWTNKSFDKWVKQGTDAPKIKPRRDRVTPNEQKWPNGKPNPHNGSQATYKATYARTGSLTEAINYALKQTLGPKAPKLVKECSPQELRAGLVKRGVKGTLLETCLKRSRTAILKFKENEENAAYVEIPDLPKNGEHMDTTVDKETATKGWGPQENVNQAKIINESINKVLKARLGKAAPVLKKNVGPKELQEALEKRGVRTRIIESIISGSKNMIARKMKEAENDAFVEIPDLPKEGNMDETDDKETATKGWGPQEKVDDGKAVNESRRRCRTKESKTAEYLAGKYGSDDPDDWTEEDDDLEEITPDGYPKWMDADEETLARHNRHAAVAEYNSSGGGALSPEEKEDSFGGWVEPEEVEEEEEIFDTGYNPYDDDVEANPDAPMYSPAWEAQQPDDEEVDPDDEFSDTFEESLTPDEKYSRRVVESLYAMRPQITRGYMRALAEGNTATYDKLLTRQLSEALGNGAAEAIAQTLVECEEEAKKNANGVDEISIEEID